MYRPNCLTLVGTIAGLLFAMGSVPRVSAAPTAKEERGRAAWHITEARRTRQAQAYEMQEARYCLARGGTRSCTSYQRLARMLENDATLHEVQAAKHTGAAGELEAQARWHKGQVAWHNDQAKLHRMAKAQSRIVAMSFCEPRSW